MPWWTNQKLTRGYSGEQDVGFLLGKEGYIFATGPSGSSDHRVNAPGFDGVAYHPKTKELLIYDNKSLARAGPVGEASALVKNLEQNLRNLIAHVRGIQDLPGKSDILTKLDQTLASVQKAQAGKTDWPKGVRLAIFNAGGQATGLSNRLRGAGIEFIDYHKAPAPPRFLGSLIKGTGLGIAATIAQALLGRLESEEMQAMLVKDLQAKELQITTRSKELLDHLLPLVAKAAALKTTHPGSPVFFNLGIRSEIRTMLNPEPGGYIPTVSYVGTFFDDVDVSLTDYQGPSEETKGRAWGTADVYRFVQSIPCDSVWPQLLALDHSSARLQSDVEIRQWLTRMDPQVVRSLPLSEKIRMADRLLDGWLSAEDIHGIEILCRSAAHPHELAGIRQALEHRITSITDLGQRTRVRVALQGR